MRPCTFGFIGLVLALARAAPAFSGEPIDLEAHVRDLGASEIEVREAAARALEALPPASLPAILQKLEQLQEVPVDVAPLLRSVARLPRRDAGDVDRLSALLEANPDTDGVAYRLAATTLVLAQALANQGTPESLAHLLSLAADHDGAFAAQVARIAGGVGERAVPALVTARADPRTTVARAAAAALESMGKERPGEQVQLRDEAALADTLRAYGSARDLDALNVTMSFINASRPAPREAARAALAAYGDAALPKLREAYANLTGSGAPPAWSAGAVAAELFLAADRARLHDVYALMQDGLAAEARGDFAAAASTFDKVLARDPAFEQRGGMASTYLRVGQSLEDHDPTGAEALLRKAARMGRTEPWASRVESELAYLEGRALEAHGITDITLFRRALALNPENLAARAAVDAIEAVEHQRSRRFMRLGALTIALLLIAAATPLAARLPARWRRRRAE